MIKKKESFHVQPVLKVFPYFNRTYMYCYVCGYRKKNTTQHESLFPSVLKRYSFFMTYQRNLKNKERRKLVYSMCLADFLKFRISDLFEIQISIETSLRYRRTTLYFGAFYSYLCKTVKSWSPLVQKEALPK